MLYQVLKDYFYLLPERGKNHNSNMAQPLITTQDHSLRPLHFIIITPQSTKIIFIIIKSLIGTQKRKRKQDKFTYTNIHIPLMGTAEKGNSSTFPTHTGSACGRTSIMHNEQLQLSQLLARAMWPSPCRMFMPWTIELSRGRGFFHGIFVAILTHTLI